MAKLITVFWRDIPAQVIAKRGRDSTKVRLSRQEAAKYLGLEFEYRFSGYGDLARALVDLNGKTTAWPS